MYQIKYINMILKPAFFNNYEIVSFLSHFHSTATSGKNVPE